MWERESERGEGDREYALLCYTFITVSAIDSQQNTSVKASNYGKRFFIGFTDNSFTTTDFIRLIIAADRNTPVQFDVRNSTRMVYSGTTTSNNPAVVDLSRSQVITGSTYSNRNKGVHIHTTGSGQISVLAVHYAMITGTVDPNTG